MSARIRIGVLVACLAAALLPQSPAAALEGSFCDEVHNIVGIGSVTQAPVHAALFIPEYEKVCAKARGRVAYQGAGDTAGVQNLIRHDIRFPFYASDLPLSALEKQMAERDTSEMRFRSFSVVQQIPIFVNGFAVAYNLGNCNQSQPLRLRGVTLSLIYSGAITRWNHPLIVADNPQLESCSLTVNPATRLDPAGPTVIFKDYLARKNPAFVPLTAKEATQQWPPTLAASCRGTGESGMATCAGAPGGVAYVEYKVARSRGLQIAALENGTGGFVRPGNPASDTRPRNCGPAAESALVPPATASEWSLVSLANAPEGYPICGFTYIFVFQDMGYSYNYVLSYGQVRNTVDYLTTIVGNTVQGRLGGHGYQRLPAAVQEMAGFGIAQITW